MIFKWQYANGVTSQLKEDRLFLGRKCVGRVYPHGKNMWRAESYLPDSSNYGGVYLADFPAPGTARGSLEVACSSWVNDACLWRDPIALDTMKTPQGYENEPA
ncbi:hypothetical protein [Leclercia sp.]|uniref:hypothetical protein n=1 Tax=Leclercia sp. TaxID=1898428 RepID=UPI002FDD4576